MAIGFMSFGGMLTGGDEKKPSLDSDPSEIGVKAEKVPNETKEEAARAVSVSEITTLTKQ
jgi:Na+-transporting NADH:ubiquinone oxidoreductase subunit E